MDNAITLMEQAGDKFKAALAERGIPFSSRAKGDELPSWVLKIGDAVKPREWAATPAKTTATAVSATPAVKAPKAEPKRVQGEGGVGRAGTTAEQVRTFIREAMQKGLTVDTVIERCKGELGFADSKAKRYATENWERVKNAK
jgi:hypothetical protein